MIEDTRYYKLDSAETPIDFKAVFAAIMHYSKDGLFVTDHRGIVIMVNRATERMVDFEIDKILGCHVKDIVAAGYYSNSCALEVLKRKEVVSMIQIARSGQRILATGIPVFGAEGELLFVLVNDRDISHLEYLSESLEKKMLKPEAVCQFSNSELIANELDNFVIRSSVMHKVFEAAIQAAKHNVNLVITGDSGVGKSMIARMIHRLSVRKNRRFVDINCGAINEHLMDSELFGYEKGAFTGASPHGKKGLFEIAEGGTLFLDEVSEIPLHLQVKLLRFIEGGEMLRIGAIKPVRINTRIIAATNRNLEKMVQEGTFRRDLYYRLNVVPLQIPALKERRQDIGPLIDFFLEQFCQEYVLDKKLSRAARNVLLRYDFPGNVRELENLLRRLVTMTAEREITVHHLPPAVLPYGNNQYPTTGNEYQGRTAGIAEAKEMELQIIADAVRHYGSQHKAAKALDISQATISRRLRNFDTQIIHK